MLNRFLRSVVRPHEWFPGDMQERAALYRSVMADGRYLVLLDDAVDEAQIWPLLPSGSRCLTVITSRRPLTGLAGTLPVTLGTLPAADGLELLSRIAGPDRVAAEPTAAAEVVAACCGLPLARGSPAPDSPPGPAGPWPTWPAGWPTSASGRPSWPPAISPSGSPSTTRTSSCGPRRSLFRQLAPFGVATFAAADLADLADIGAGRGTPAADVEQVLEELLDAQLVQPAGAPGRTGCTVWSGCSRPSCRPAPMRRTGVASMTTTDQRHGAATVPAGWTRGPLWMPESLAVTDRILARAAAHPDRPAIEQRGQVLSYAELVGRAGCLARVLRGHGVGPESRVGVCLRRTPAMPVAALGVLLAGGAYVPVSPDDPERRRAMVSTMPASQCPLWTMTAGPPWTAGCRPSSRPHAPPPRDPTGKPGHRPTGARRPTSSTRQAPPAGPRARRVRARCAGRLCGLGRRPGWHR